LRRRGEMLWSARPLSGALVVARGALARAGGQGPSLLIFS
jgi:hypothetical protein